MAEQNGNGINVPPQFKQFGNNIRLIILAAIAVVVVFASVFTIGPEEVGVITRFGAFNRVASPGLNMKLPFAESVYKVPVERQLKQEFGFRTVQAGVQTRYSGKDYSEESLMLTGDLNLANVEWVVQYRISDPYKYLFKVRNPENSLSDISEAAMRQVVGDRTVNEVLTVGRAEVASEAQVLIQKLCEEYETGIKIEQVVLQDINPPDPVKPSFNAVNEAQQERETLINEAKSAYNKVVPRARGQADETIQEAEGYKVDRVNRAKGEASRFNDLYKEYIKAPEVTKRRLYLETLERVIPKMGNKIITDDNGNSVLPLLQMQMQKMQTSTGTSTSKGTE